MSEKIKVEQQSCFKSREKVNTYTKDVSKIFHEKDSLTTTIQVTGPGKRNTELVFSSGTEVLNVKKRNYRIHCVHCVDEDDTVKENNTDKIFHDKIFHEKDSLIKPFDLIKPGGKSTGSLFRPRTEGSIVKKRNRNVLKDNTLRENNKDKIFHDKIFHDKIFHEKDSLKDTAVTAIHKKQTSLLDSYVDNPSCDTSHLKLTEEELEVLSCVLDEDAKAVTHERLTPSIPSILRNNFEPPKTLVKMCRSKMKSTDENSLNVSNKKRIYRGRSKCRLCKKKDCKCCQCVNCESCDHYPEPCEKSRYGKRRLCNRCSRIKFHSGMCKANIHTRQKRKFEKENEKNE